MGDSSFASDNASGAHPAMLAALARVNPGHYHGYGDDPITADAEAAFGREFGPRARPYLVFNGSAANVLCLGAFARAYDAVICSEVSHILTDECGAAQRLIGCTLLPAAAPLGKLTPETVSPLLRNPRGQHANAPRVLSVTQPTELGTCYSLADLRALAELAHAHRMVLHMDGARLANAAARLECTLEEVTVGVGVDALSFGGTKNGLLLGDAVVLFRDPDCDFLRLRKQALQLGSKMRFLAAQFTTLLAERLWWRNADHANRMADRLAAGLQGLPGVAMAYPVQANGVFAVLPPDAAQQLQERYGYYFWDQGRSLVRLMCGFDTPPEFVDAFLADLGRLVSQPV